MAFRRWWQWSVASAAVLMVFVFVHFLVKRQRAMEDIAGDQARATFDVRSSSFANGERLPKRLTCDGASLSPELEFSRLPAGMNSLAIVMIDKDAPVGFVHWLVYNIPGEARSIAEGASSSKTLPPPATEGLNSVKTSVYIGPCPARGKHEYVFRVYALNVPPNLQAGMNKQQLAAAVRGHVLAEGQLSGVYARNGS